MSYPKRHGIMLCQPLDERNLARNFKLSPNLLAQPKLDGIRCRVEWYGREPVLVSSEGNQIEGVPHIDLALRDLRVLHEGFDKRFDGELYSTTLPFEEISSRVRRNRDNLHPDCASIQYHIFDYQADENQLFRTVTLAKLFSLIPESSPLQLVHTSQVHSSDDITTLCDHFVKNGYEGIVIRNPSPIYLTDKRPFTILKWKPSKSDWYLVQGVEEAISETGQPLARLGSLVCDDGLGQTFRVGPGLGLTHEHAKELWEAHCLENSVIGQYAHVYYQNLTRAGDGVPRFGKFTELQPTSGEAN